MWTRAALRAMNLLPLPTFLTPKSTSKKVKEVKKAKGIAGEHLGAPPYGYLQNPDDKTRWLVDEEAASAHSIISERTFYTSWC